MSTVNKVILIGHLGADPEKRYTGSGQAVTTFSIATTDVWTDKNGEKQERTEWHRIIVWGNLAETCAEYLTKGRLVYIEGRLQSRQWEDNKGNKRNATEIIAQTVRFLGKANTTTKDVQTEVVKEVPNIEPISTEDDIPF